MPILDKKSECDGIPPLFIENQGIEGYERGSSVKFVIDGFLRCCHSIASNKKTAKRMLARGKGTVESEVGSYVSTGMARDRIHPCVNWTQRLLTWTELSNITVLYHPKKSTLSRKLLL